MSVCVCVCVCVCVSACQYQVLRKAHRQASKPEATEQRALFQRHKARFLRNTETQEEDLRRVARTGRGRRAAYLFQPF